MRLCTEQINWSTPTATYHLHLHKRARPSPRSRFLRQFRYYLSARRAARPTPAISHHRLVPVPSRPIEKTEPVQTGVSNVCERDEMQTGAILFIVRRLYMYRALPVLGRAAECRQGRIYLLYDSKTSTL